MKIYYWYHHCLLSGKKKLKIREFTLSKKKIENAILKHDFELFCVYQRILNNLYYSNKLEKKLLFLPYISKNNFMKIKNVEYECG